MNENETFEFENRTYLNPDISRDEQTDFINTLRDIQAQNNAQIATETHNLGTDIDHPRGGLSGSEEYWKGRYQTPQTEAAVANLKAVAQQSALNDALSNYNNMLQNRYSQAYRDYNRRVYEHNRKREREADEYYKNSTGGSNNGETTNQTVGEVEEEYSNSVNIKNGLGGLDAIQESMVKTETERIMKAEGLNLAEARAKALDNLGLSSVSPTSNSQGEKKSVLDRIEEAYGNAKSKLKKNDVLPSWDSYGFNNK